MMDKELIERIVPMLKSSDLEMYKLGQHLCSQITQYEDYYNLRRHFRGDMFLEWKYRNIFKNILRGIDQSTIIPFFNSKKIEWKKEQKTILGKKDSEIKLGKMSIIIDSGIFATKEEQRKARKEFDKF